MKTGLIQTFSRGLGFMVYPAIRLRRRLVPVFRICGYTGLFLAILVVGYLVHGQGLSFWIMAGIIISSVLTFLSLAIVTKLIIGEERLIYYHQEIAVMIVASVLLWLLQQPVLVYLDITILGLGVFLAFGRIGCLMAGCCHGLPSGWGVVYRVEHSFAGPSSHLVGVRLFPVQALESLWVFGIVIVGAVFVMTGRPPGDALTWYVVMYGLGRFFFEFMRGDSERHYYLGFSEAQWTSLLLGCAVVWAGLDGRLTFYPWHLGALAFLGLTMLVISLRRTIQGTFDHSLMHPRHIREVAEAAQLASSCAVEGCDICKRDIGHVHIDVGCTSLGIQISASRIKRPDGYTHHYALSYQNGKMSEKSARLLTNLILRIRHPSDSGEIVKTDGGVFHLLVHIPWEPKNFAI